MATSENIRENRDHSLLHEKKFKTYATVDTDFRALVDKTPVSPAAKGQCIEGEAALLPSCPGKEFPFKCKARLRLILAPCKAVSVLQWLPMLSGLGLGTKAGANGMNPCINRRCHCIAGSHVSSKAAIEGACCVCKMSVSSAPCFDFHFQLSHRPWAS